jgi:hypothetical protein
MTRNVRLIVLGLATAVNAAALTVVDAGMAQSGVRAELAILQPVRIVVTAPRAGDSILATQTCPAPKVL